MTRRHWWERTMRARSWRGGTEGEYQVVRRWRWAAAAARVYEAFHRRTGAPALILKPGRPADWSPAAVPWRAVVSSTPERLAVELSPMPRSRVALEEVTLGLFRIANALAQVDTHPAAQSALAGDVAAARRWRARYSVRPRYVAALAAAAILALLAAPRAGTVGQAAPHAGAATQLGPEGAARTDGPARRMPRPAWAMVALPMPPEPFKGQARPDKAGKCERRGEVAINGGCWQRLGDVHPPCEGDGYEHKGGCYWPVYPPVTEPQAALRAHSENP